MTDRMSQSWDEMLEDFRRLGGVAENVRPGTDSDRRAGPEIGLFALDPKEEVRLYVPPKLLVPVAEIRLEGDALTLAAETSVEPAVAEHFVRFQAAFGFGAGAGARCRRLLADLADLPEHVRTHLKPVLPEFLGGFEPPTDERVLNYFLRGRIVQFGGKPVLPTLPGMINHRPDREAFDLSQGLRFAGQFDGEVLTRYSGADAWELFLMLGIVAAQAPAFSLPIECRPQGSPPIRVDRNIIAVDSRDGLPVPQFDRGDDRVTFSHVLLGHRRAPGLPRAAFMRIAPDAGIENPATCFDMIAHINRTWFIELLRRLETVEGDIARAMRAAALMQLDALSCAIGDRLDGGGKAASPTAH